MGLETPEGTSLDDRRYWQEAGLHEDFLTALGWSHVEDSSEEVVVDDPKPSLKSIRDWWRQNREKHVDRYEAETYSEPDRLFSALKPRLEGTADERRAWFTLILRSTLETLGRTRASQNLAFIQICEQHGWLRAIADTRGEPEELVSRLRDYIDKQAESLAYRMWLGPLFSLFLVSPWLDEYIESLLALNFEKAHHVALSLYLNPRTNPAFSGGGADAPPLQPFLGIGACFLIRELVRKKIIDQPAVYPFCYVPNRRVRQLLRSLGAKGLSDGSGTRFDQSRSIHSFLVTHLGEDDAAFLGDFDLPFQVLAKDPMAWAEVAGYEVELLDDWDMPEDEALWKGPLDEDNGTAHS